MNALTNFIETKLIPVSNKIAQNRYIKCLSSGSMSLMAIILIGGIFNLLNSIGFEGYQSFITATGISKFLSFVPAVTTNAIALYMVFAVAYQGAKIFDHAEMAFNNGLLALMAFLILIPQGSFSAGEFNTITYIDVNYIGARGIFLALIVAILVTKINIFIVEKKITIKMPEGVPSSVSDSFTALIPGFVIAAIFSGIALALSLTSFGSANDLIYGLLQKPISSLTGSLPAFIIAVLFSQVLWFFGIHGSYTILPIFMPIWFGFLAENSAAVANGEAIPNIFNCGLFDLTTIGGCGCTLGLVIVMFFFAKSKRYKTFANMLLPCGIFNINEPLIFGMPLMLNATLLIPFLVMPILSLLLGYGAIALGLMPAPIGLIGATSVPVFFSGIMQGSWKIGVFQIVIVLLSVVVYYPFFKALDKQACLEEAEIVTEE